jgi:hypothetical protein
VSIILTKRNTLARLNDGSGLVLADLIGDHRCSITALRLHNVLLVHPVGSGLGFVAREESVLHERDSVVVPSS